MIKNFYSIAYTLVFSGMLFFSSCKSYQEVGYFKNIENVMAQPSQIDPVNAYQVRIAADDLLSITVSALDPASVIPFNMSAITVVKPTEKEFKNTQTFQSYLVNSQGYIQFPVLGELKVGGLTKQECIHYLQDLISQYVKDPIVNISILNYRFSVLGEVNEPGAYIAENENATILDAIAQAGDLTLFGIRNNVLLIRTSNGQREYHRIDLTRADFMNEPYFHLQQGDVIYVEPNEHKKKNSKYSQSDSYNMSIVSTVISSVSVIASLVIALLVK